MPFARYYEVEMPGEVISALRKSGRYDFPGGPSFELVPRNHSVLVDDTPLIIEECSSRQQGEPIHIIDKSLVERHLCHPSQATWQSVLTWLASWLE